MADTHRNAGFERLFGTDGLTVGTSFPLTRTRESTPPVAAEMELAKQAETLGFDALWARDVPLHWPAFGDTGQSFDVWPWLGYAAANTSTIALGTASIVLPLRHPIHVAKSAASVDRLSGGRLVMGVATGDREPEFPAFGMAYDDRGERFRESVRLLRRLWGESFPELEGADVSFDGEVDLVPKPTRGSIPLLPTGHARQSTEWIAEHGDGWLFYQLPDPPRQSVLEEWRELAGSKPYAMNLRVALAPDRTADPEPIHQGFRAGAEWFREYFRTIERIGVDHVIVSTPGDDPEGELVSLAEELLDD